MKTTLISILFVFLTCSIYSQEWNERYGTPVVALTETNPWLMVIGSDVPTIAIYQYGDVIYKSINENKVKYYSVKLKKDDLQTLIYELGITENLMKMPDYVSTVSITDQPDNILSLAFDSVYTKQVYGNLRDDEESRTNTPEDFLYVYDQLIKYTNKKAKEWLPEYIEVMLTDYSHSPEQPLAWPDKWPDLTSASTIKRTDMLYSLYLPKKDYKDFIKLISSLKEKQAVEVNGKLFSVSYRFPYPNLR